MELPNGDLLIRYSTGIVDGDSGILHMKYRWEVERRGKGGYREGETEFDLKLLRANQLKALMEGAGLQVVERVPLVIPPTSTNRGYLKTKRKKLGHLIPPPAAAPRRPVRERTAGRTQR